MTPNVLDLYHGDNNERPINWQVVVDSGFKAVFHKVSQGLGYADPKYAQRMATCPLKRGGYHFLTNAGSGIEQWDYFITKAKLVGPMEPNFQVACDYERSGSTTPTPQIAYDFLMAAVSTGYWPWIYGSDLLRETISSSLLWRDRFGQFKLWLAEYGPKEIVPVPWSANPDKTIWQYSERGSIKGISGHVDLNICTGDLNALWSNNNGTAVMPPPAVPTPHPILDELAGLIKKYS